MRIFSAFTSTLMKHLGLYSNLIRNHYGIAMYKIYLPALVLLGFSVVSSAADSDTLQRCNLQARELALQANEKLLPELDVEMRSSLAMLAEEVCLDYFQGTVSSAPGTDSTAVNAAASSEQEDDSPFGSLRMIEPEDRVQRPGLKRR